MAHQRSLTDPVAGSEYSGGEAHVVVNGEEQLQVQAISRVVSGPAGPHVALPARRSGRQGKGKSIPSMPAREVLSYPAFRRLCEDIISELSRIDSFLDGDEVTDEGSEIVAEVEALLEQLYACEYGQGESLKRVVVAVQSQVNNARWDRRHVEFIRDIIRYLRVRYLVDEAAVDACYDLIKARRLDEFRGTISAPEVVKRYRIEEVDLHDESSGTKP